MTVNNSFLLLLVFCLFVEVGCRSTTTDKTDEQLYERTIFTDDENKTKIKVGDKVTFYYCLQNGDKVIMSSEQVEGPTTITISDSLNRFERPLMWLGLGDSCVVYINSDDAVTELLSYKEHFKEGDKATFIYKVLKID